MNLVVTGEIGVGKTTVCQKLADALRSRDSLSCGGVLQPAITEDGVKTGSNVVNLSDGSSMVFARIKERASFRGVEVGRYRISFEGIAFASRALESSLGSDVIFVDEVGPLEFSGRGLLDAVQKIVKDEGVHVMIVRRKLLSDFYGLFSKLAFKAFEVTLENRDNIFRKILRETDDNRT